MDEQMKMRVRRRRANRARRKEENKQGIDFLTLTMMRTIRDMTRDELRALAKKEGVAGYSKLNKAALADFLVEKLV